MVSTSQRMYLQKWSRAVTSPALGPIKRPETAVSIHDIRVGDKIVSYTPGQDDKKEIEFLGVEEIVDFGEESLNVSYRYLDDTPDKIRHGSPSDLGLSQNYANVWHKYAIPFDENI